MIYVEVIGGGVPIPSNSMQPFSEHAVPFEQQPPPTTAVHSKLDKGHWGGRDWEARHSESEAVELQQKVPELVYGVEWQDIPTGQQIFWS